ncbi:SAM-dependent methyltransferase [Saccharopolyspora shandongensis]|uniref:SAM-dependent methyltransferase n=1 Tax=Saccharopolyspora shandongensis TaxID=418495 RepID=UPI0033FB9864
MAEMQQPPALLDTTKATIARVYDASLGGKDNYEVDRQVWRRIQEAAPHQGEVSKMNRHWLVRVVRYLADEVGIDQFLDLGSGLPTVQNTHQVAQHNNREARVVYVDNDPVCSAHGRALLEENAYTHFVMADLTRPAELLGTPQIMRRLDLEQPLVLMQCGTLHHVSDDEDPAGIMRQYIDALASGSYVALTHFWDPCEEDAELHEQARSLEHSLTKLGLGTGWWRRREQIQELFGDLEMVSPGLVELDSWWPSGPLMRERYPEEHLILGGVGRKR